MAEAQALNSEDRLDPQRIVEIREVLAVYVSKLHDADFMRPHAVEALEAVEAAGSRVSAEQARLVLRVLSDFERRVRELDDDRMVHAMGLPSRFPLPEGGIARRKADTEGFLVLEITNTANAAFEDLGRNREVARIIGDVASKAWRGNFASMDGPLRDTNGNQVGSVSFREHAPTGELAEGGVRLTIKTTVDVDEDDPGTNVARVIGDAAGIIKRGEAFIVRDRSGVAAWLETRDLPSNERSLAADEPEPG